MSNDVLPKVFNNPADILISVAGGRIAEAHHFEDIITANIQKFIDHHVRSRRSPQKLPTDTESTPHRSAFISYAEDRRAL